MSDQSDSTAKKATKVKSPTPKELKRSQDRIRQQNKVKRTNKGGRNNTSGDITTETIPFSPPSTSSNPEKTFTCTEVPRDENILIVQSGEGQSYKRKIDDAIHPNIHLDYNDISGSSTPILSATEGSLSHSMDDESKQMHANSLDVKVSNNPFLKDSLPVIEHAGSSGEGLPYAPENWPSPGDVWTWRVGKRYTLAGFWQDRSVHPPNSLGSSTCNKMSFNSRVSLEQYIRKTFPDADVDAFFASFIWKIPCTNAAKEIANAYAAPLLIKSNGCSEAAAAVRSGDCRASNEMCSVKAKTNSTLTLATCYICCTEPNFCRYCCCILCSKTIDWIYDGYTFIKCEAPIDEKFICGHVAHIECALHAYMAGKVGGSSDLDAQYYCRCCDNKTDLLLHVDKIIKVCESIDNRDDKGKVLNLGLCILRGSEKETAKKLRNHITMLIEKLKQGASLEICKKKSEISEPIQDPMTRPRRLQGALNRFEKSQDAPSKAATSSTSKQDKDKEQIERSHSEIASGAPDTQAKQTASAAVDPKERTNPTAVPPRSRPATTRWDVPNPETRSEIRSKRASDPKHAGATGSLADVAKKAEFKHAWTPPDEPSHPLVETGEAHLLSCFNDIHLGLNKHLTDFTGNLKREFGGFHRTMESMKSSEVHNKKEIARLEALRVTELEELKTLRKDNKTLREDITSRDKVITDHTTTLQNVRDEYAKFKDNHFADRKKEKAVHEQLKEEHTKLIKKNGELTLSHDELILRFDELRMKYDELSSNHEAQTKQLQEVEETNVRQQKLLDQADVLIDDIYFQVGIRGGDLSWIGAEFDDVQQMIAERQKSELAKSVAGSSEVPPPPVVQVDEPDLSIIKEIPGEGPTKSEHVQTMAAQVKASVQVKTEVIEECEVQSSSFTT